MTYWHQRGSFTGDNAFRLMPSDEFTTLPASVDVRSAAAGYALIVSYRWQHPEDGLQSGALFIASPDEGVVEATLVDSWHQKPGPMRLVGTADGGTAVALRGSYFGEWGWEIDLSFDDGVSMVMRNVVPESALAADDAFRGGAYDVMRMHAHSEDANAA